MFRIPEPLLRCEPPRSSDWRIQYCLHETIGRKHQTCLEFVYFRPEDVEKIINKLKSCSSPGPDYISSHLLKEVLANWHNHTQCYSTCHFNQAFCPMSGRLPMFDQSLKGVKNVNPQTIDLSWNELSTKKWGGGDRKGDKITNVKDRLW